jgi:hypothetical protein
MPNRCGQNSQWQEFEVFSGISLFPVKQEVRHLLRESEGSCFRLNVSPQIHMLKPQPPVCLYLEVGPLRK